MMLSHTSKMMRKQLLLICFVALFTIVIGETPICDPKIDRHCFDFEEHDVESTFDGVGEVVTPAPVVDESEDVQPPTVPVDGEPKDETISAPSTNRSSKGEDNGLRTGAIVAMSVGGALLLVGAAVMRRRKLNNADSSDISAIDSMQPSGDNTV